MFSRKVPVVRLFIGGVYRQTKCYSTDPSIVRVRFAPSPTGSLHIGGARTAIYNWLLAKKTNGVFVIRVEDTDEVRSTRDSEKSILDDLAWLNLHWDEGPDIGGNYKPYRQSERKFIYEVTVDKLLKRGNAYRCFSQELPDRNLFDHKATHIPSPWRDASDSDIEYQLSINTPYTVKFKVPAGKKVTLHDRVFGEVVWDTDTCLHDFIIMRSNGMPVYNFCVAVDDMDMQITHVIRAQEHLTNTLKQLLVLEALQFTPPTYAHCSILLGADGTKLSKRHGAASVGQFRAEGYLPEAIVSYLGNFANNNRKTEDDKITTVTNKKSKKGQVASSDKTSAFRVVYSPEEIVSAFSLEGILKGPAVFDVEMLKHINREYIKAMSAERLSKVVIGELSKESLSADGVISSILMSTFEESYSEHSSHVSAFLAQATKIALRDMILTGDVRFLVGRCLHYNLLQSLEHDPVAREVFASPSFALVGRALIRDHASGALPCASLTDFSDRWNDYTKQLGEELGLKGKKLFQSLRLSMTGSTEGPEIADQLRLAGLAFSGDMNEVLNPTCGAVAISRRMSILSDQCSKLSV